MVLQLTIPQPINIYIRKTSDKFGIVFRKEGSNVVVSQIRETSPAISQLRIHDIISAVNDFPVSSHVDVVRMLQRATKHSEICFRVCRPAASCKICFTTRHAIFRYLGDTCLVQAARIFDPETTLKEGDIVFAVNNRPVYRPEDAQALLHQDREDGSVCALHTGALLQEIAEMSLVDAGPDIEVVSGMENGSIQLTVRTNSLVVCKGVLSLDTETLRIHSPEIQGKTWILPARERGERFLELMNWNLRLVVREIERKLYTLARTRVTESSMPAEVPMAEAIVVSTRSEIPVASARAIAPTVAATIEPSAPSDSSVFVAEAEVQL